MWGLTRSDGLLIGALLISVGFHGIWFLHKPAAQQHSFKAPAGHSMAVTLGSPPDIKQVVETPQVIEQLVTTTDDNALSQIIPKKEEPEIIEPEKPDIVGELEELIVTREVQLSSKPTPPIYPERSRRDRQEGLVLVRAQVDHLGKTHEVKIAQSSGFPLLDQAALDAVAQWSFLPAKQNEQAIAAWIEVPIDFKLR